jgi:glycerol-3-phosphate acyltransferase PlsY
MVNVVWLVTALLGYLLGSVPTGYLVARARGVDIRASGSGNIGATNVLRALGKPAGLFVLAVDGFKGYIATALLPPVVIGLAAEAAEPPAIAVQAVAFVSGLAAVLGHNYTCWLGFRGGKGIATTAGVLAGLMPAALGVIVLVWVLVTAVTRYVSVGSLAAAVALPLAAWGFSYGWLNLSLASLLGALAIYTHRTNIQRLINGTEHRFGRSSATSPDPHPAP